MFKSISLKLFRGLLFHVLFLASFFALTTFQSAWATTGFARQTGEPCAACHQQGYGPWLTPYGQKFKLDGYVAGVPSESKMLDALKALSLEVIGSVSNTGQKVPGGQYYGNKSGQSHSNNNVINDWTALYFTGRVTDKVGAYLQLNLNPQVGHAVTLSMVDIRFADHTKLWDNDVTYGISLNNAPTMSDTWMTAYSWMYPYTTSSVTLKPAAQPYLASLMGGNTAGATAYTMINNHFYLEAGGYTSQAQKMAQGLGSWTAATGSAPQNGQIVGGAPYWRAYMQHTIGSHNMMLGTYGFMAKVIPFYQSGNGYDRYEEYNIDANYSYMLNDDNMFMAMFKYTRDNMKMNASNAMGYSSNAKNHLNSLMLMGMWTYKQTYNLTVGWNKMTGSADFNLYNGALNYDGSGSPAAFTGSANGSPNTNSFMFEADYVPFGKGTSKIDPYLNLRLSLQYWAYTKFNGSSTNYDGAGRNASDNNVLYFSGNLMF